MFFSCNELHSKQNPMNDTTELYFLATKTKRVMFTKKEKYTHPMLKLNATVLPLVKMHQFLDIVLNYRFNWHIYLKETKTKARKKLA